MTAHERAIALAEASKGKDLAEANTRHQIIDPLLHEVLGWPRAQVSVEEFIEPGFADYVLQRSATPPLLATQDSVVTPLLLIEAKREGKYFEIPKAIISKRLAGYVQVKTLLTDPEISAALLQVRTYCLEVGCDFAAITNGHQWIFFRTYQKGENWKNLRAFVIGSLQYFADNFTEAHNILSFTQIADEGSLNRLLLGDRMLNRELFYPKERITAFTASIDVNGYAPALRPLAEQYFAEIEWSNKVFMNQCYVIDREYDKTFQDAKHRIEDALTPYLEQFGIQDFKGKKGGKFANRLERSIKTKVRQDTVVLFGGKGVGKSTFLKRLLFVSPPQVLKKNSVLCIVDLLSIPETEEAIERWIWTSLVQQLDRDNLLKASRDKLELLFADRLEVAVQQDLYGLRPESEAYNLRLNELVAAWRSDLRYCAKRLVEYWRPRHKGAIVVIDNTDQYLNKQEYCFTIAQDIAAELGCLVVVSMREERFYGSSIRGTLDAFANSGFHISAPAPNDVFLRRIEYVLELLGETEEARAAIAGLRHSEEMNERCQMLFRILVGEFRNRHSHLANFLTACAHGNIRLALDLFRGILLSGYTNVYEMTHRDVWTFQIHQVLKPIMIPYHFFYDETRSQSVPNVFQIRSKRHGSHFTALRILTRLSQGHDPLNPPFVPVKSLEHHFVETFGMKEDFVLNADNLLKRRLIEASNRLDSYSESIDSVRITSYGLYMLNYLAKYFTYVELVCTDCAIAVESVSNDLAILSNADYTLYTRGDRINRLAKRIEKAKRFIGYLEMEEDREFQLFGLNDEVRFVPSIKAAVEVESEGAMRSATRHRPR